MKTRERIINAAIPVFAAKGRHGAHVQEIASYAHINKAMIYYIFHNKDDLYFEVLKHVIWQAHGFLPDTEVGEINNKTDFRNRMSDVISMMIRFFSENRNYTKIIVDAMSNGASEIQLVVKQVKEIYPKNDSLKTIQQFIEQGKNKKFIRDIDTEHLLISIMGMVIIYFLSNSISDVLDIEVETESKFLEARRENIIDLVMGSIMVTDSKKKQK